MGRNARRGTRRAWRGWRSEGLTGDGHGGDVRHKKRGPASGASSVAGHEANLHSGRQRLARRRIARRRRIAQPAGKAGGQRLARLVQPLPLASHLQHRVTLQRIGHQVAAHRHLGVDAALMQLAGRSAEVDVSLVDAPRPTRAVNRPVVHCRPRPRFPHGFPLTTHFHGFVHNVINFF